MTELPAIGFVESISNQAREFLTLFGEFKEYDKGVEILKQDYPHHYLYLVLEGAVEAYHRGFKGDVVVGTIEQGSSFGEFSMLFEQHPTATIRSIAKTKVWRIESKDFKMFCQEAPGATNLILIELMEVMGNRLRSAGQMLVGNAILNQGKEDSEDS